MISTKQKEEILQKAKIWFQENVVNNHLNNIKKLTKASSFNINPFITRYLSNFLDEKISPHTIAKTLIYPRILGTSINTTFGNSIQNFTNDVLGTFGSTTSGIDIEYYDLIDKRKKYCQMKAGPNTINKDDVTTIHNHFKSIKNLSTTNNLKLQLDDMIVGVVYGNRKQISQHYKILEKEYNYTVLVGNEFWTRLTGDKNFYDDLITSINQVRINHNFYKELNIIIDELANDENIIELSKDKK